MVGESERLVNVVEGGVTPQFHRAVKPLKQKNTTSGMLLKNVEGVQSQTKEEQGIAVKQRLALIGRGVMRSFEEHLDFGSRQRRCGVTE